MKRNLFIPAVGVAALLALGGCAAGTGQQDTTPGAASSSEAGEVAEHNSDDVTFAQQMIQHHRQAVAMSEMILAKEDIDPAVADLATRIKEAQEPEIETMTGWLESWGEPVEMPEEMGGMSGMGSEEGMSGTMNEDQMAELESAEGTEASKMFLAGMTEHHLGAVEMAQQEIENGSYPDAIALAETIVETQQAEIEEMKELLKTL